MRRDNERVSQTDDSDGVCLAVFEEVVGKLEKGEPVDLDQYERDHPECVNELRRMMPTLEAMVELGQSPINARSERGEARHPVDRPATGVLGDFRILREIGRGGMGIVYETEQISLGRRVALKVLPFAAMIDPRQLQRFQNEARAAASLKHANIVQVYSVGCERGVHHYAMEYIEGQTLAAVISDMRQLEGIESDGDATALARMSGEAAYVREGQPFPDEAIGGSASSGNTVNAAVKPMSTEESHSDRQFYRRVAKLGVQAAEALEHAHQMGVVHRDIKPSNLMLDVTGHLSVTDFGLAMTQTDANLTMTGDVLGTLRYMSPEQSSGKSQMLDHRCDIYSLGATLYELLTLQPVFPGSDRQKLLRQIAEDEPRPPRQLMPMIPGDLETIVLKALAKEPQDRYRKAEELAADLRRFIEDRPVLARRPSLLMRISKWGQRHRALVWSAVTSLVIISTLLAVSSLLIARAYQREKHHRRLAEERLAFAVQQQDLAERQRALAQGRKEELRQSLYAMNIGIAHKAWQNGSRQAALGKLNELRPHEGEADLRGFEWYHLWHLCHSGRQMLPAHKGDVYGVAFSPDG